MGGGGVVGGGEDFGVGVVGWDWGYGLKGWMGGRTAINKSRRVPQ